MSAAAVGSRSAPYSEAGRRRSQPPGFKTSRRRLLSSCRTATPMVTGGARLHDAIAMARLPRVAAIVSRVCSLDARIRSLSDHMAVDHDRPPRRGSHRQFSMKSRESDEVRVTECDVGDFAGARRMVDRSVCTQALNRSSAGSSVTASTRSIHDSRYITSERAWRGALRGPRGRHFWTPAPAGFKFISSSLILRFYLQVLNTFWTFIHDSTHCTHLEFPPPPGPGIVDRYTEWFRCHTENRLATEAPSRIQNHDCACVLLQSQSRGPEGARFRI